MDENVGVTEKAERKDPCRNSKHKINKLLICILDFFFVLVSDIRLFLGKAGIATSCCLLAVEEEPKHSRWVVLFFVEGRSIGRPRSFDDGRVRDVTGGGRSARRAFSRENSDVMRDFVLNYLGVLFISQYDTIHGSGLRGSASTRAM